MSSTEDTVRFSMASERGNSFNTNKQEVSSELKKALDHLNKCQAELFSSIQNTGDVKALPTDSMLKKSFERDLLPNLRDVVTSVLKVMMKGGEELAKTAASLQDHEVTLIDMVAAIYLNALNFHNAKRREELMRRILIDQATKSLSVAEAKQKDLEEKVKKALGAGALEAELKQAASEVAAKAKVLAELSVPSQSRDAKLSDAKRIAADAGKLYLALRDGFVTLSHSDFDAESLKNLCDTLKTSYDFAVSMRQKYGRCSSSNVMDWRKTMVGGLFYGYQLRIGLDAKAAGSTIVPAVRKM